MPLDDVALITISKSGKPITRVGFGTPMIADVCAAWGASQDRIRTYKTPTLIADLVTDGFVATDAVYKAASAFLAQDNPPPQFKVGRRANKPTQHWTITPTAQDSTKYQVTIDGTDFNFTSGVGTTVALIVAGLKAAIDAALPAGITTTNIGPNTALGINTALGAWHYVKAMRPDVPQAPNALLDVKQDQADPGIAADLDAIRAASDDWYCLLITYNSKAEIEAAAAWTETNKKLFLCATQDSNAYTNAVNDVLSDLKAGNYFRTAALYYHNPGAFPAAAWAGSRLSTDPGSENWAFAALAGIEATTFTGPQQAQLDAKYGNYVYTVAGESYAWEGKVSGNDWIDAIRGTDWLKVTMQEDILQLQVDKAAQGKKVSYDDPGIASYENVIRASLKKGVRQGFLAADPAPTVTVPLSANVVQGDRDARVLNGIVWTAQKAGAINVGKITGVLT